MGDRTDVSSMATGGCMLLCGTSIEMSSVLISDAGLPKLGPCVWYDRDQHLETKHGQLRH